MASEYKVTFLKLMSLNLLLLHSQCHCSNFSEPAETEVITDQLLYETNITNNTSYSVEESKNNSVSWREDKEKINCISLTTSRISLILNHHEKNTQKHNNATKQIEIDLISINQSTTDSTIQIERLCSFNPKILKIGFNTSSTKPTSSPKFDGVLKFYFLTQEDSYRLVLVDLVVTQDAGNDEKDGVKTKSSYFAFRATEDFAHKNETANSTTTSFGSSSYCRAWVGVDPLAETWIKLTNLQYQVRKDGEILNGSKSRDNFNFSPIGHFCSDESNMMEMRSEDVVGWWKIGVKTPFYKFLLNICLLLGGCGIVIIAIFALCKFCPVKVKEWRKSVFQV